MTINNTVANINLRYMHAYKFKLGLTYVNVVVAIPFDHKSSARQRFSNFIYGYTGDVSCNIHKEKSKCKAKRDCNVNKNNQNAEQQLFNNQVRENIYCMHNEFL